MNVRPIDFGSAEYQAACELRRRFLREPLGLELTAEDLAGEESQHHFVLLDERGEVVGAVIGKPDPGDPLAVRIRQMVIHADRRERGLGRELLRQAELVLAERGYSRSVLYARAEAAPFYERCGYRATGAERELIGLVHQEMQKPIGAAG